ncbi:hypothetical protein EK21DRAFT_92094 [Setomelanomma holmii]|uniref:Uncharacterized protein n=1 Tax=Setomelanomma holmii TaxID=210430 RepID=A0A9P4H1Y3_9PLEO|nr:hypothetical protein EK21DRAFT_92094 [Setomelanomma holmii]
MVGVTGIPTLSSTFEPMDAFNVPGQVRVNCVAPEDIVMPRVLEGPDGIVTDGATTGSVKTKLIELPNTSDSTGGDVFAIGMLEGIPVTRDVSTEMVRVCWEDGTVVDETTELANGLVTAAQEPSRASSIGFRKGCEHDLLVHSWETGRKTLHAQAPKLSTKATIVNEEGDFILASLRIRIFEVETEKLCAGALACPNGITSFRLREGNESLLVS